MKTEIILELHKNLCEKAFNLMEAKNRDYAGGTNYAFANFKGSEVFGVPAEIGLMIRMMDKFKRVESFLKQGKLEVVSEPVDDIPIDLINYAILLAGLIEERRSSQKAI